MHSGRKRSEKDGGQIECISTEVIRPICMMWLQTEQAGGEISPMLPGQSSKYPTHYRALLCWELESAGLPSDSIIDLL